MQEQNTREVFTMSDMGDMSDMLHEAMSKIMSKTSNTLKYRHWRVRLMWKNLFNLHNQFDNAYTENVYYIFKSAISVHIEDMNEDETNRFINNVCKTMKEM